MALSKIVKAGEAIPRGYGFGRYDMSDAATPVVVCYPLGLNLVVSAFTLAYYFLLTGIKSRDQTETYKAGFGQGQMQGQEIGYYKGYADAKMDVVHRYVPQLSTKAALDKQAAIEATNKGA